MTFYRATFPNANVLPKMHLLEDAMDSEVAFRIWHYGAESVHASFNGIERSFACMIHNRVERLHSVMKEHHLRVSPTNVVQLPVVKKRKKT
jgi:hypothetical protein